MFCFTFQIPVQITNTIISRVLFHLPDTCSNHKHYYIPCFVSPSRYLFKSQTLLYPVFCFTFQIPVQITNTIISRVLFHLPDTCSNHKHYYIPCFVSPSRYLFKSQTLLYPVFCFTFQIPVQITNTIISRVLFHLPDTCSNHKHYYIPCFVSPSRYLFKSQTLLYPVFCFTFQIPVQITNTIISRVLFHLPDTCSNHKHYYIPCFVSPSRYLFKSQTLLYPVFCFTFQIPVQITNTIISRVLFHLPDTCSNHKHYYIPCFVSPSRYLFKSQTLLYPVFCFTFQIPVQITNTIISRVLFHLPDTCSNHKHYYIPCFVSPSRYLFKSQTLLYPVFCFTFQIPVQITNTIISRVLFHLPDTCSNHKHYYIPCFVSPSRYLFKSQTILYPVFCFTFQIPVQITNTIISRVLFHLPDTCSNHKHYYIPCFVSPSRYLFKSQTLLYPVFCFTFQIPVQITNTIISRVLFHLPDTCSNHKHYYILNPFTYKNDE